MASNPHGQTTTAITMGEVRQRVYEYINTELALDDDFDMEYPLGYALEVPVTHDQVEGFVCDFVVTQLPTYPESQRERAVEIFANAMPILPIDAQANLGVLFEAGLDRAELPLSLSDIFWESLPEPLEFRTPDSPMEFEPVPMDLEDVLLPLPVIFPWFEPSIIITRDPPKPIDPLHGPQVPDSAILNDIHDLTIDLINIRAALAEYHLQMCLMMDDIGTLGDPLRANTQRLLSENTDNLNMVVLPEVDDVTSSNFHVIAEGLGNAERLLTTATEKLFEAEKYLVAQEAVLHSSGDIVKGQASRYERSRYRSFIKWRISGFRTPRLRKLFMPSTPQPQPTVRKYDESEPTCPICINDLPEEGEICPPAAVSFPCCNKGFHTDCLLGWMIEKIARGPVPCPMCREPLDLAFFGEILEMKVRELQVL